MDNSFRISLDNFLNSWRDSSVTELCKYISKDYKAREICDGKIADFGYEESIQGWEQGFCFVNENNAHWKLDEISIIPLRANEVLVIIAATMVLDDKSMNTANLFFETFKKVSTNEWMLIRSYIEAGIPKDSLNSMNFNYSGNHLKKEI